MAEERRSEGSDPAKGIAKAAKVAFEASQLVQSSDRIKALHFIREELESAKQDIFVANKSDVEVRIPAFSG